MKVVLLVLTTLWSGSDSSTPSIDVIKFSSMEECEVARIVILQRAAIVAATLRAHQKQKGIQFDVPDGNGACKEISN